LFLEIRDIIWPPGCALSRPIADFKEWTSGKEKGEEGEEGSGGESEEG